MKKRYVKDILVVNSGRKVNKRGDMTMKYLLTFVLAGVLLALVMYGVYNKGFGPLIGNIEGRANEVLILLNIKDVVEVSCGEAFEETIKDVGTGKFYPCDDSCTFVLDSGDLLGYNNFSISRGGFLVESRDGSKQDNSDVFTLDSAEVERQREAFIVLNETVNEFLDSNGMSVKDFSEAMSFDPGRKLYFAINDIGDDTAYLYDDRGIGNWIKGEIEGGKFVAKGKEGDFMVTSEVKKEILSSYGILWVDDDKEVRSGYLETIGKNEVFVSKIDFEKRFDFLVEEQKDFSKGYTKLSADLTKFLGSKSDFDFMGDKAKLIQGFSTPQGTHHSLAVVLWISGSDQFHMYYENSNLKFSHNFKDSYVSRYAGLSNEEWQEFIKINKIYQHFNLRRCVKP